MFVILVGLLGCRTCIYCYFALLFVCCFCLRAFNLSSNVLFNFFSDLAEEVDLFKAVGLGDKAFAGVTKTTGQNDQSAAYRFTNSKSDLIASQQAFEQADKMIHNSHDFIVSAYVKLDLLRRYDNPIVSISSQSGHDMFFKFVVS